jgi:uncharacterized membrane protein (UPF0182 family)
MTERTVKVKISFFSIQINFYTIFGIMLFMFILVLLTNCLVIHIIFPITSIITYFDYKYGEFDRKQNLLHYNSQQCHIINLFETPFPFVKV